MASDFIKEKIKEKPVNKRRLFRRFLTTVLMAVVFGAVAALTYMLILRELPIPGISAKAEIIRILDDDEGSPALDPVSENETLSEDRTGDALPEDHAGEALPEKNTDAVSEDKAELRQEEAAVAENRPRTVINNITNKVNITPEQYEHLYTELKNVVRETERSLVTVTGSVSNTDWFENTYEYSSQGTGVIIADNNREILILTSKDLISDAEFMSVTFCNGAEADAHLISEDYDTELCIIGARISDLSEETRQAVSMAVLGNSSRSDMPGRPVIAAGSPLGTAGSQIYGFITSDSIQQQVADRSFHLLTTDIYGSTEASGVLLDFSGRILGIITSLYPAEGAENLITAYSISDIKNLIERLANSQEQPFLGIYGSDVTPEISDKLGVPSGAYVTGTVSGSPAMAAGIQGGDVITKFGTNDITCFEDYIQVMEKSHPGEDAVISVLRYARGEYMEMTFEVTLGGGSERLPGGT